MYHTVIFLIIICRIASITDLSLTNCPSTYLKFTPVQTQNGFVDMGQSLYSAYQFDSYKQSVYKIVMLGDTEEYTKHYQLLQIPYIMLGLVFIITMAFVVLWCFFPRSCPPWRWTKRDTLSYPYTRRQMRYTLFWLLVFAMAVLIICVFVLSQIPALKKNITQTKCSIYVTIDTALNGGNIGTGWDGFRSFKNNLGNISSLIGSTTTQMGLYFTGDDWLKDDITVMKTKNNYLYTQNKDAKLVSPNPTDTQVQAKANLSAPLIDSLFIKRGLGPIGQLNTLTTQVQTSVNITQKLADQASLIDQGARFLDDSAFTIKNNFILALNTLNMYIRQFQVYIQDYQLMVEDYFTLYFTNFLYTIQIIIAVCLVGTMLIFIGGFATSIFGLLDCRKMVHLGWFIYAMSFVGGLVLMYLFIGLGSIGYGFCQYYKGLLNGEEVFQKIKAENSQNVMNRLHTCIKGNGNVLQTFGVFNQIKTLEQLYTNINIYNDYTNNSSPNWVNFTSTILTLNKWIDIIQKYRSGIYIDSNPIQTNDNNPNYALSQLNLYSNTGGGVQTCSKDRWVFDKANCTDLGEQIYITSDQTNGKRFTTNKVLCISFNDGFMINTTTNTTRQWTQDDFLSRYVQIRKDCSQAYGKISSYGTTLISYRNSRINLFQGIKDTLNELLSMNIDFNLMLGNFRGRVTQFSQSTKTLKNLILSQSKGIQYTTNCSIVGEKMKDTNTVFCRNFMSQIVRLGLLSIFLTIALAFGIWAGSLFAVRYSQIQRSQRLNMPESQLASQRELSDKKSQESN